ncbi:hypothetical protein SESBI_30639 [Sesbania bispinosa]|nr:hypothetical protein SESBI_30639 [Sesbania bispinosa]
MSTPLPSHPGTFNLYYISILHLGFFLAVGSTVVLSDTSFCLLQFGLSNSASQMFLGDTCAMDIGSMPHVAELASKASKVTVVVYNHMIFLSWLRGREGWTEIVRPGVTCFATTFITLKSIYDHKHDLQALVADKHFTSHRWEYKKRSYDPIDYESIDKVEFWVIEEEAPPEFDVDDIENENVIYQDNAIPIVDESHNAGDEEIEISRHPMLYSHDLQPGSDCGVSGSSANANARIGF